MSPFETLGFALGTSFASGLNVYATIAAAGLFQRFGVIQLPDNLQVLASPFVLGIAITLFLIEFIADKIPYVDSAWDAVHTFIRPPAAAIISYSAFGQVSEEWKVSAALLAGGVGLFLAWRAATHPILTAAIVVVLVVLAVLLIWRLFGYLRVIRDRLRRWRARPAAPPTGVG